MSTLRVLLVEDDEIDRRAVWRAFRDLSIDVEIVEAHDGQEALDILAGVSEQPPPRRPFVILLDLNMPVVDGIGFLRALRDQNANLPDRDVPVFALTTSASEKDIEMAYRHGVAGYIVKSDYVQSMSQLVDLLAAYRDAVEMPSACMTS